MASYKLNMATIDHCPEPREVLSALEEYGLPENEEFGVLNCSAGENVVYATVVRRTHQAIQRLDLETGDLESQPVEKATLLPFGLFPARGVMEVYEGASSGIEQIGGFLGSGLALPIVVNPIEIDVTDTVQKLRGKTERFVLKGIRISDYAHSSYMSGPYAPKFLDTENGLEFLAEFADYVTTANCRFKGPAGNVTVAITPNACFRYSMPTEDDKPSVQAILRQLL